MSQDQDLVVFKLITHNPTTYTNERGEISDKPVSRKVMGEFTIYEKDKAVKYRHIKNASTILLKKQEENGEQFAYLRDEIYFTNGIVVLHPIKDRNTIEILRKSPQNTACPESSRPFGVEAIFEEVVKSEEGRSELDEERMKFNAKSLVMSLQSKDKDGYKYDMPKIKFLSNLFKLDGDMSESNIIISLLQKAEENPDQFIYSIETAMSNFKRDIDKALELKVISIDKGVVILGPSTIKKVVLESSSKKDEEILDELVLHYSSPDNKEEYDNFLKEIYDAEQRLV